MTRLMTRFTRHPAFAQALLALALLLVPVAGAGQELRVTSDVPADQFIARDATGELQVSRTLDPATEGLAVFFGTMDMSPLFLWAGDRPRYATGVLSPPSGERDLVVYHVTEAGWREVVRQPMKVAGRLELESVRFELRLAVGHVAAGNQRHLMNRFGSRGTTLTLAPGSRVDATFAALHGSSLVGWDGLLGGSDPDHPLLNATVGIEALERPGALRIELSALEGSILPRPG